MIEHGGNFFEVRETENDELSVAIEYGAWLEPLGVLRLDSYGAWTNDTLGVDEYDDYDAIIALIHATITCDCGEDSTPC